MHLKFYHAVPQEVPQPNHPGRTTRVFRLVDAAVSSHAEDGHVYHPDENGWFDFPLDVAERLQRFRSGRYHRDGWYAEGTVADQVRLGALDEMDRPAPTVTEPRRGPGRPRKDA